MGRPHLKVGFDTLIAAHQTDEELPLALREVAGLELGVQNWGKGKIQFGEGVKPPSPLWGPDGMMQYGCTDVGYTHLLYEKQRISLAARQSQARLLKYIILPGIEAYTRMELTGIYVDPERLSKAEEEYADEEKQRYAALLEFLPEPFRQKANFTSAPFLRSWIFGPPPDGLGLTATRFTEKTKMPATDEEALLELDHPALTALLEWRETVKARQFFVQWREWMGPDGRIHPSFNQAAVVTGRRSCNNPNLQQVPRNKRIRPIIGAAPGWWFLEVDYAAVEVRLAAWISGDKTMLKLFADGRDPYRFVVAYLLHLNRSRLPTLEDEAKVTKDERQAGKAVVLGFQYGLGEAGFVDYAKRMYGVDVSREQAGYLRDGFFELFNGYPVWHDRARKLVNKKWEAESPVGRVRHLKRVLSTDREIRSKAERQAINCVDSATEALTREGWSSYDKLHEGQEILTKNPSSGLLEWQPIEVLNVYPEYEGDVYRMQSRCFSAVTTPNHRWLVDEWSGTPKKATTKMVSTDKLQQYGSHRIHRSGEYEGPEEMWVDDEVRLFGWLLTDGHLHGNRSLGLTQSQRGNPHKVLAIEALLDRLGISRNRREVPSTGAVVWEFHVVSADRYRPWMPARKLTASLVNTLSGRQAKILVDTMMLGDGCEEEGKSHWRPRRRLFARDADVRDAYCMAAVLAGYVPSYKWVAPRAVTKDYPSMSNRPVSKGGWRVTLLNRDRVHLLPGHTSVAVEKQLMWCPTVANGTFVARREGSTYITGNSPVQGLGGDLTLMALVEFLDALDPDEIRPVGDIHDALLFEVRPDRWKYWAEKVLTVMEHPPLLDKLGVQPPVRLRADAKISTHWSDPGAVEFGLETLEAVEFNGGQA